MNLDTMYPGIPYSPSTVLTQPINATDTTIYVDDISVFPAAPNIAVIGTDESAETIIYGSKSGNMLSGVQRGVEGTAKAWEINDEIARNWTNKDFLTLISNINKLKTNADGLSENIGAHMTAAMPHRFTGTDGKTYQYGFRASADGSLIFAYEEVQ